GTHLYKQAGSYHVVVYAQGADGTSTSAETDSVIVAPMPSGIPGTPPGQTAGSLPPSNVQLYLSGLSTVYSYAGVGFQENAVAVVSGNPNGQPDPKMTDYQAQINWGDSDQWDKADLANLHAALLIKGTHIYTQAGSYHVVVYAQGADGTSVS